MTNPSKAKGTAAESQVVRWLRQNGFPGADRLPLKGNRDAGDIGLTAGVIAEIKAHRGSAGFGQPAEAILTTWMKQARTERVNAGADLCPLIVKRSGTVNVGRWFAYLTLGDLLSITTLRHVRFGPHLAAPVCIDVATLTQLLRLHGYGDRAIQDTTPPEHLSASHSREALP